MTDTVNLDKTPARIPSGTPVEYRYGRNDQTWKRAHVRHLGAYAGVPMYALRLPYGTPAPVDKGGLIGWDWAAVADVRRYR